MQFCFAVMHSSRVALLQLPIGTCAYLASHESFGVNNLLTVIARYEVLVHALLYLAMQRKPSTVNDATPGHHPKPSMLNGGPWNLSFEEIAISELVGEGSFGRASQLRLLVLRLPCVLAASVWRFFLSLSRAFKLS